MNRLKRITMLLMAFLLVLCVQSVSAANQQIEDMPEDWSEAAVEKAVAQGWLTPYNGRIYPDRALTRAEMAAIVNRIFRTEALGSLGTYTDVPASGWYAKDMAKAVQMGAFVGEGDKLFPDRMISRQEAFTVVSRIFEMGDGDAASLRGYADEESVAQWARSSMASLVLNGYVKGSGTLIRPEEEITRAEFAQLMSDITGEILTEPGEYTKNYEGNLLIAAPGITLKNSLITGDLILCDGVASGDVTLDHVTLEGRMVIRGGGKDTIRLVSSQVSGDIVINNVNHAVRLLADKDTGLNNVVVRNQVILGAEIPNLRLAEKAEVTVQSGKISHMEVSNMAAGSRIEVEPGAVVNTVAVSARDTSLSGKGQVTQVLAKADDVSVNTGGTKVTVEQGVTGVRAGGVTVAAGETAVIDKSGSGVAADSKKGSGKGNSGGDSNTPGPNPDPDPGENPDPGTDPDPGENPDPGTNPDPEPGESPTSEEWVKLSKTGIIQVDFVSFASVALQLSEMNAADPAEYDYYINGVKLDNKKDVSTVMKSADGSLLVVKMLLPGNTKPQLLKLVKGSEYLLIQLDDIGSSVQK